MSKDASIGMLGGGRGGGEDNETVSCGSKQGKEAGSVMEDGARVLKVLMRTEYRPLNRTEGTGEWRGH